MLAVYLRQPKMVRLQSWVALLFLLIAPTASRTQSLLLPDGFEVASVKRSTTCGPSAPPSPGRVDMRCIPVQTLIENAFHIFADGQTMKPTTIEITGGPSWMRFDTYDIQAKASAGAKTAQMFGPMMQVLLEDRFKLRLHHQAMETPVYFIEASDKGVSLPVTKDGSCVVLDIDHPFVPTPGQPRPIICGRHSTAGDASKFRITGSGLTIEMLASDAQLSRYVGRPIIDKTSLTTRFDINLEFSPNLSGYGTPPADGGSTDGQPALSGISLSDALQRMGLKLVAGKASVDSLVIDHLERPTEN